MFLDDLSAHNLNDTTLLFAKYFSSVYSNNISTFITNDIPNVVHDLNVNVMFLSEDEILDYLKVLKDDSVSGRDGIPPIFFKKLFAPLWL